MFGNWKYIFKNIWFILPFALVPAVFLALSVDYAAVNTVVKGLFGGEYVFSAIMLFRAWSLVRFDSVLGAVYSVCAFGCTVVFAAMLLSLVEKHMRIGKRTLSGAFSQLGGSMLRAFFIGLLFLFLYELWAFVLSCLFYVIGAFVTARAGAYVLMVFVFLLFVFVLLYVVTVFYLWFPCMQLTGIRPYEAFRYSYQVMVGLRFRLIFSMLISFVALYVFACAGAMLLPDYLFRVLLFVLFVFLFLSFCVRMETAYFKADKLDREDVIRSYREL